MNSPLHNYIKITYKPLQVITLISIHNYTPILPALYTFNLSCNTNNSTDYNVKETVSIITYKQERVIYTEVQIAICIS